MQRKVSAVEHRLTALYALNALGGVTGLQLLQFMVENELMDYISLQLALYDLETAAHTEKIQHPLGALYELTEKGTQALALFIKRIPESKRLLIDQAAPLWRRRFEKEKEVIGTHHVLPGGASQIELMIRQGSQYLLLILLPLHDRAAAQRGIEAFCERAETIYASLFETLSRDYVPGKRTMAELPACAMPVQGQKHLIEFRAGDFSVMLPLPDGDMACHFATAWEKHHNDLYHMLLKALNG